MHTLMDLRRSVGKRYGPAVVAKATDRWVEVFGCESQNVFDRLHGDGRLASVIQFAPGILPGRRFSIADQQAAFDQQVRHVRDVLLRAARHPGGLLPPGRVGMRTPDPEEVFASSWLGECARTIAHPRAIAEIAEDPRVLRFDRPRRLCLEASVVGQTVWALPFRQATGFTGRDIKIALLDGEADRGHPALAGRVTLKGHPPRQWSEVAVRHATAVAGLIGSHDPVYPGIAPGVTFSNYVIAPGVDDFGVVKAIEAAVEERVHLIILAYGAGPITDGSSILSRAAEQAWDFGVPIIKSAGNRQQCETMTIPADARRIIVVGATDKMGQRVADYSRYGRTAAGDLRPHLVAPGGTADDPIFGCRPNGAFGPCGFGTSFAAAVVAGVSALLLEEHPRLTPAELLQALIARAVPIDGVDPHVQGHGLIVLQAVSALGT